MRVWEVGELLMRSAFGIESSPFSLGQVDPSDQLEEGLVSLLADTAKLSWCRVRMCWFGENTLDAGTGNHR